MFNPDLSTSRPLYWPRDRRLCAVVKPNSNNNKQIKDGNITIGSKILNKNYNDDDKDIIKIIIRFTINQTNNQSICIRHDSSAIVRRATPGAWDEAACSPSTPLWPEMIYPQIYLRDDTPRNRIFTQLHTSHTRPHSHWVAPLPGGPAGWGLFRVESVVWGAVARGSRLCVNVCPSACLSVCQYLYLQCNCHPGGLRSRLRRPKTKTPRDIARHSAKNQNRGMQRTKGSATPTHLHEYCPPLEPLSHASTVRPTRWT